MYPPRYRFANQCIMFMLLVFSNFFFFLYLAIYCCHECILDSHFGYKFIFVSTELMKWHVHETKSDLTRVIMNVSSKVDLLWCRCTTWWLSYWSLPGAALDWLWAGGKHRLHSRAISISDQLCQVRLDSELDECHPTLQPSLKWPWNFLTSTYHKNKYTTIQDSERTNERYINGSM